jgi:hypothetical protein
MVRIASNRRRYFGSAGLDLAAVGRDYCDIRLASSKVDSKIDILAFVLRQLRKALIFVLHALTLDA